jgi:hypothetical protein
MKVNKEVSIAIIQKEIAECKAANYGWSFSPIDETNLTFQVEMQAKDGDGYIVNIKFDNYKQWPLDVDFIDPITQELGVKTAYPFCKNDSFFHKDKVVICHPFSRRAYKGYTDLHTDWGDLTGWQSVPSLGQQRSLKPILESIYYRITGDTYEGRMEKRTQN